jgi:hypothetical protein
MSRTRTTSHLPQEPEDNALGPSITVCEGCKNQDKKSIIICYMCKKDWHSVCMAREGIRSCDVRGQWKCCKCSKTGKPPPSQPAHTDDTHVMMLDQQAEDAANKIAPSVLGLSSNIVPEELYMHRMADHHGDHLNFSKITVVQAENDYKEAIGRLSNVLREREACRECLYQLKSEIELFGHELEDHRKHFHSDGDAPSDGKSTHQQLVHASTTCPSN